MVRYPALQAQSIAWGPTGSSKSLLDIINNPSYSQVNLRFTDLSLLAGDTMIFDFQQYGGTSYFIANFIMRDSQIRGGKLSFGTYYTTSGQTTFALTNNLAQRATVSPSRDNTSASRAPLASDA